MGGNNRQIWSEDACRLLASDLRAQAQRWENRADEIKNYRGNIRPVADPAPAMKAAIRVLEGHKNGLDPATECRKVCRTYFLDYDAVWQLFGHKKSAYERDKRRARNSAIIKQHLSGQFSTRDLATRYALSHGQISKIISPPDRKKPAI